MTKKVHVVKWISLSGKTNYVICKYFIGTGKYILNRSLMSIKQGLPVLTYVFKDSMVLFGILNCRSREARMGTVKYKEF